MKAKQDQDSDLADLLQTNGSGNLDDEERVPLNLDKLANGNLDTPKQQAHKSSGLCGTLCGCISAHLSYLCFAYPKLCGGLACLIAFVIITIVVAQAVNPTQKFGIMPHDWTSVKSQFDLDAGKIDHWCLGGGNDNCRCTDPLVPQSRVELRSWTEAFKDNKNQIAKYMDDPAKMAQLDVAIIGESAVEEMDGRWMGRRPTDELQTIGTIFKNHFKKSKDAKVEGVALGIAGDSANNVLWRLMHGEMPDGFEPKVWWVSVGMNDLARMQCSEEVVVMGVLRVVEEILNKRPNARVIVNSLFPMADLRGGTVVKDQDYKDAFMAYKGKKQRASATHYVRKNIDGKEQIVPARGPKDKTKKKSSDSNSNKKRYKHRRYSRRLVLEAALEAYDARKYDNSEEIDHLQRELNENMEILEEFDTSLRDSEGEESTPKRRLGEHQREVGKHKKERNEGPLKKHRAAAKEKKELKKREKEMEKADRKAERRERDVERKERKRKKDKYNPTIDREKHKQKKYSFFHKRRMPLWTSIYAINKQLFKFCEKHDRVDFFDATNVFAERKSNGAGDRLFTLMSDMISARGHPTELGYMKWEDAIVKRLIRVLEEMRKASPDLFQEPISSSAAAQDTTVARLEKKPVADEKSGKDEADETPPESENNSDSGEENEDTEGEQVNEDENMNAEETNEAVDKEGSEREDENTDEEAQETDQFGGSDLDKQQGRGEDEEAFRDPNMGYTPYRDQQGAQVIPMGQQQQQFASGFPPQANQMQQQYQPGMNYPGQGNQMQGNQIQGNQIQGNQMQGMNVPRQGNHGYNQGYNQGGPIQGMQQQYAPGTNVPPQGNQMFNPQQMQQQYSQGMNYLGQGNQMQEGINLSPQGNQMKDYNQGGPIQGTRKEDYDSPLNHRPPPSDMSSGGYQAQLGQGQPGGLPTALGLPGRPDEAGNDDEASGAVEKDDGEGDDDDDDEG